jgi:hydroxymethylpyrimidine/phosphomethylpyrimidine kinase
MEQNEIQSIVTIGISNPQGVGGVQADLSTLAAMGVHGAAVVTGIDLGDLRPALLDIPDIVGQLDAAAATNPAAVKIGAVGSEAIAKAVAEEVQSLGLPNVVVDPSMAQTDDDAANEETVDYLKSALIPVANVAVINIHESCLLTGLPIRNPMGMKAAAKLVNQMGAERVVVSGGQIDSDECIDFMFDGEEYFDLPSERVETNRKSGIGAIYSAAIASGFAYGRGVEEGVAIAKMYVTEALSAAYPLGDGAGAPSPMYAWWAGDGGRGYGG